MNISSSLQNINTYANSTATYIKASLTPSQATMDKTYAVAVTTLKAVAVLAGAVALGIAGYAVSQSSITNETLAQITGLVITSLVGVNAATFPADGKVYHEAKEDTYWQKYNREEREAEAAQQAKVAAARSRFHGQSA